MLVRILAAWPCLLTRCEGTAHHACRCTLFRRCSMTHPTTKSHLSRSCIPHTSSCSLNARLRLHVGTDDASAAGTTKRLTTILLFLEQVEKSCLNSQGVVEWGPRIALLSQSFLTFYDAGIYPLARRKRIRAHLEAFSRPFSLPPTLILHALPSSLLLPKTPALSRQTTRTMRRSWTTFLWCKSSQLHPSMSRARILKALS